MTTRARYRPKRQPELESVLARPFHQDPVSEFVTTRADQVKIKPPDWLWRNRIPKGHISMLAAVPASGKSIVSATIAAIVTQGAPWPDGAEATEPGSVYLVSHEDDHAESLVPRLVAAGADLSKVYLGQYRLQTATGGFEKESRRPFEFPADLELFEEKIKEIGDVRLIVIDPLDSYMHGSAIDQEDVLPYVNGLCRLVQNTGTALIGTMHTRKESTSVGMQRFYGAKAWHTVTRKGLAIVHSDKDPGVRLLFVAKENGTPTDPQRFQVVPHTVDSPAGVIEVGRVEWLAGGSDEDADAILSGEKSARARPAISDTKYQQCLALVQKELPLNGTPTPTEVLFVHGEGAGFTRAMLRKAAKAAGWTARNAGNPKNGDPWMFYRTTTDPDSLTSVN